MKNFKNLKRKILLTAMLVIAVMLTFTVICSAKDITVGAEGCDCTSMADANKNASNGDTVIVKSDISGGTFNFAKSITYILEADWTNVSGYDTGSDVAGKTISVYARGGNRKISFGGDGDGCYFNSYNAAHTVGTVINFGGEDDYTLTLDVSGITRRFIYGFSGATVNFYDGTIYTGSNKTATQSEDTNIDCGIFNLYEGAEIYGNKVLNNYGNGGLVLARTEMNIYGGKIYGNALSCTSYSMLRSMGDFNMYGGEIYDNYLLHTSQSNDQGSGIVNAVTQNIYGGKIYNNYIRAGVSKYSGTAFGSRTHPSKRDSETPCHAYLIDTSVYDNYAFTYVSGASVTTGNFDTYFTKQANGAYKLTDSSFMKISEGFRRTSNNDETLFAYSVIFLSQDGKTAVEAFMFDADGQLVKSFSNGEAAVPDGYSFTENAGGCKVITPTLEKQGTYYVVSSHTYPSDDFNCETADICSVCFEETEALTHVIVETLLYANGFNQNGIYTSTCTNKGCSACDEEKEMNPIFKSLGYSTSERKTGFFSITQGFRVDKSALEKYNALNDVDIVKFGVVAGVKSTLGETTELFENGVMSVEKGAIVADMSNRQFDYFNIKITNLESENNGVPNESLELYCCGYYLEQTGENIEAFYMDEKGIADTLTHIVSYASLCPAQ